MAKPIRLTVLAALLLSSLAARNAGAEIEVQIGSVVGERFGSGPVHFTADPCHKFDPMGGVRRLDRVIIDVGLNWECVVQLANPEAVVQEVRYNAIPSFAELPTNTAIDFMIDLLANSDGVLIAPPFQTVQNLHTEQWGPLTLYNLDPNEPPLQSIIGPGPIVFESFDFATAFDTRRFVNGVPMGVPNGFSVFRERWDVELTYTYEYTIVPTPPMGAPLLAGLLMAIRRPARLP